MRCSRARLVADVGGKMNLGLGMVGGADLTGNGGAAHSGCCCCCCSALIVSAAFLTNECCDEDDEDKCA